MPDEFLSGMQIGAGIGQGWANRALRERELQSIDAERRVRERMLAAEADRFAAQQRKIDEDLRQRAQDEARVNEAVDRYQFARQMGVPEDQAFQTELYPMALRGSPAAIKALQTRSSNAFDEEYKRERLKQYDRDLELQAQRVKQGEQRMTLNDAHQTLNSFMRGENLELAKVRQALALVQAGFSAEISPRPSVNAAGPEPLDVEQNIPREWGGNTPTAMPNQTPGGQVKLTPISRPMTSAATTQIQKSNAELDTAIATVSGAIREVEQHPEAFGPSGWVVERMETAKNFVDPNSPMPITGARTTAGNAAQKLALSLKVDAQVSNYEKRQIDEVVGKPSDFWSVPGRVKEKFQVLLEAAAGRRMRQAKMLNQAVPLDSLDVMVDPNHVVDLVREKVITPEDALAWGRAHNAALEGGYKPK